MKKDEEQLIDCLDIIRIRLEAGLSFSQAISQMPQLKIEHSVCKTWKKLSEKIEEGRISACSALESLTNNLRYKLELRELRNQKSLNARIQSSVSLVIGVIFLGCSFFMFPEEIKPTPPLYAISITLMGLTWLWMHYFYKQFEKELWFGDWLLLLENISYEMSWGQTLGQSLSDQENLISKIPLPLQTATRQLAEALKKGQQPTWPACPPIASSFLFISFDHGRWIVHLVGQGLSIAQTLLSFSQTSRKNFERHLQKQGEILAWKLMIPLFVCLVPSILVLLFGPLLGVVTKF